MKTYFLWHMHQPCYLKKGEFFLPYVFLHSIKDYYDMPYLVSKLNKKATFNLTPILIEQIFIYEVFKEKKDYFLKLLLKKVDELNSKEIDYLNKIFDANYQFLMPELKKLYKKSLNNNDFLKKQTLFLLNWCGVSLKERDFIKNLINKKIYTQKDKEELIFYLLDFISEILPLYKNLLEKEIIDITFSPYSHPILPLLVNFNDANCEIPQNNFSLEEDALIQIKKSKNLYKELFNKELKGLWPSEGSVSEKIFPLLKNQDIKWIATDEIILKKVCSECSIENKYSYLNVDIFFRNHYLSDLIGFNYRYMKKEEAVKDFVSKLKEHNFIILDGENAWEYYENGGYDFLEELYKNIDTELFKNYKNEPIELKKIASGSWIDGNFSTWTCDEVKNRAWSELFRAKKIYLTKNKNKKIDKLFLIIEGSDWYWWYGKGHVSIFEKEFDEIFRNILKEIYYLMNEKPPKSLDYPLSETKTTFILPKFLLSPNGGYFDFVGSGVYINYNDSMHMNKEEFKILFGEDLDNIYFKVIGNISNIKLKVKKEKDYYIYPKKEKKIGFELYFYIDNNPVFLFSIKENYNKNWFV